MKRTIAFLATFVLLSSTLDAQKGAEYLAAAKKSTEDGAYVLAQKEARLAIQSSEQEKNLSIWIQAQRTLANATYFEKNNPFDALSLTDQALASPFFKPSNEDEYYNYCKFLTFKSWLAKKGGDFIGVKKDLEEAHRIFKEKLGGKHPLIANFLYPELGNAYVRLAEYEGARQILEENLQYSAQYPQVAKFNDYGNLYLNIGEFPHALEVFKRGLSFNETLPDTSRLPDAEVKLLYLNIAESLAQMGRFEEALQENDKAGKVYLSKEDNRFERCLFGLYENYGIIYSGIAKAGDQSKFPLAAQWYKKALLAAKNAPNREKAGFQIALSEVYLSWKKPREALVNFQKGLSLLLPKFDGSSDKNPEPEALFAEKKLILALYGKARAYYALNQLEKALECYELIPVVEAKLRATHAYESSSLLALKESRQRFHEAIDIAWQLFERSNGNPQYVERAFRLTELARGMLLLQSLVQARQYLPVEIRQKDYELQVRMAWLEHEIAAEREKSGTSAKASTETKPDSRKIEDWENQLFNLKLERQKLLAEFPTYNNPDSLFLQVLAAKDVHSLLRPGQAMVNFFLTETAAYIFSFDAQGDFGWRKADLLESFREQTRGFVSYLWGAEEKGREKFLQQAWLLDSLLLSPERKRWGSTANSLIIVPDDVLMLVPFEVLLSRIGPDGSTWRDQSWLLTNYNFGYAYSATLLSVQKGISEEHAKAVTKPPNVFGGFAPSYSQSSAYKLENTRPMAEKVCNLLGGKAWLGKESSEACFKNSAANYRTLLLAMHGISDNEYPELSRLLFGDSGPDSLINNNILYASELQIMRLQADLVVLSACHSGSGKLEQGEGVYSLARAFAAARVPATVMSLWLLHENTAPPLVEAFFQYLQQGKTKDEALRLAKLDFIKNDDNFEMTHPFFWAGLAAAGDMRALDLPVRPRFEWGWCLLLTACLGAGGFWWWKRRKMRLLARL